jgi:hypothetical protein
MEQTPQPDLTIGQAHGGHWKDLIEQHNLVARQVLTPEEASKLLNHSVDQPIPADIAKVLDRCLHATSKKPNPAPPPSTAR